MKQFASGFIVASVFWVGALYAQSAGMLVIFEKPEDATVEEEMVDSASQAELSGRDIAKHKKKKRRGRRSKNRRSQGAAPHVLGDEGYDTGEGISGDDLGAPGSREIALQSAKAEDQLKGAEIDQGIDLVFKGIERCLVLVPAGAPAAGKVIFGMHIASSGQVTKVNLKGPNVLIKGEPGACFRRVVKSIRYRSFDGPDMIVHYPVVFE